RRRAITGLRPGAGGGYNPTAPSPSRAAPPAVATVVTAGTTTEEAMSHSAEISRANPTCFLFLIDQSKSMLRLMAGGQGKTKAESVADCINHLLYSLVLRCVWGQSVLDRFHVGVIGYGVNVGPALGGPLAGKELVPISEVARNP